MLLTQLNSNANGTQFPNQVGLLSRTNIAKDLLGSGFLNVYKIFTSY